MFEATLKPLANDARDIDDVLIEMEDAQPELAAGSNEHDDVPNIVPFPLSARTAGVA